MVPTKQVSICSHDCHKRYPGPQLWTAGLGVTRLFIHVLPSYPALTPLLQPGADIPRAQSFAAQTLSISNSHWLTDELFEQVLDHLRRILKR